MMNEPLVVVEATVLEPKPGDLLVITYPQLLNQEQRDRIKATLKELVPEGVRVAVMDAGADVKVVRTAQ